MRGRRRSSSSASICVTVTQAGAALPWNRRGAPVAEPERQRRPYFTRLAVSCSVANVATCRVKLISLSETIFPV
jgi:hypothetical protein